MELRKKKFIIFIIFILLILFFIPRENKYTNTINRVEYFDLAKKTEYYDWSEIKNLDQDYSFSTIYLTEKTEFKILKNDGTVTYTKTNSGKELPNINKIGENGELVLLITNCAVNKDGEILDIVIKINKVVPYKSGGTVQFSFAPIVEILNSQNNPSKGSNGIELDIGDPFRFLLNANLASCDFTMTYYKTGTYNATTDSGDLGNITLVNGLFYDLDTQSSSSFNDQIFKENEGVRPNVGSSTIYYNKNKKQPSDSNYQGVILQEIDNGIAIETRPDLNSTDSIWYATSALILTKDIINSTYSFTYGGVGCGISWFFSPPSYVYDLKEPVKKASVTEISPGESFTYEILQYIPNNYYSSLIDFGEIYSNLSSNSKLKHISIKDNLSSFLDLKKEDITITTETDKDVTNLFDINLADNELLVTAKENNLEDSTFYSHTYTLHVPVTLKSDTEGIANIKNVTNVISKMGDEEEKKLTSNELNIDVLYKLIVNYLKEGTNEVIFDPKIAKYNLNYNYVSDYPFIDSLELISIPDNANGIINKNTIINYYYRDKIEMPIIENPNTGFNKKKFIILIIVLFSLMFYFRKYHKKIYKI